MNSGWSGAERGRRPGSKACAAAVDARRARPRAEQRRAALRWVAAGLLLVLLLNAGCATRVVRRHAEKRIEQYLHETLGPADEYRVRVYDTKDHRLVLGRANRLVIEGHGVLVNGSLPVESIRGELHGIRYQEGDIRFFRVRRSELEVELTEEGINTYLREHQPRYQASIQLDDGRVRAAIIYRFAGIPTPITATGRLEVVDSEQLIFHAEEVDTELLNAGFDRAFVEDRVNPVVDLRTLEWPVLLESVRVEEGRVFIRGSASIRIGERDPE